MTEDQFEKLAQLIQESHEDLAERIDGVESKLGGRMDSLEGRMDKLEVRMEEGFAEVRADIRGLDKRLEHVEEKVDNLSGVTKEVDFVLSEITAIKAHVGMQS
jgi:tetrahydromethanopterin S-methyltransferase subunit G